MISNHLTPLLLVEDDLGLRRALARALEKHGFDVDEAGTAQDARQRLGERRYDVVVTDLHLPGSGHEVVRAARREADPIPVVVITADGRAEARRRATAAGATRVVRKPVGLILLLREIEKARREVATRHSRRPDGEEESPSARLRGLVHPMTAPAVTGAALALPGAPVLAEPHSSSEPAPSPHSSSEPAPSPHSSSEPSSS